MTAVKIYVDADACPKEVKDIIMKQTRMYDVGLLFVASYQHYSPLADSRYWVFIDDGKEAVDLYLMNRLKKGDLVITQDIGLASLALAKGVYALSPRGKQYTENTIETSLSFRYLYQEERKKGRYGGGPKKLSQVEVERFAHQLNIFLSAYAGKK